MDIIIRISQPQTIYENSHHQISVIISIHPLITDIFKILQLLMLFDTMHIITLESLFKPKS